MRGDYPQFKVSYPHDELIENFHLAPADHHFIRQFRGDLNRNTVAVLLQSLRYLGYFPDHLTRVPEEIRLFLAQQLNLFWDCTAPYAWESSTKDYHCAAIRQYLGWRFPTAQDKEELAQWLRVAGAPSTPTEEDALEAAYERWRGLQIELPTEKELRRLVNGALKGFFQDLYAKLSARLAPAVRARLDQLLIIPVGAHYSGFDTLKAESAAVGVDNLKREGEKLQQLRAVGVKPEELRDLSPPALRLLQRRARNERVGEMREHPAAIRYSLLACFVFMRTSEVTDEVTQMMLEIIHRMDTKSEQQLDRKILQDLKKVEGKVQLLFRIADAITQQPGGTIRAVIFPRVKEEVFHHLAAEYKASGPQYRTLHQTLMHRKYACHYRQMLPVVLEQLTFRRENRYQARDPSPGSHSGKCSSAPPFLACRCAGGRRGAAQLEENRVGRTRGGSAGQPQILRNVCAPKTGTGLKVQRNLGGRRGGLLQSRPGFAARVAAGRETGRLLPNAATTRGSKVLFGSPA